MFTEMTDAPNAGEAQPQTTDDETEVPAARAALVKKWQKRIENARKFWRDKAFNRMDKCMQIAAEGGDEDWTKNEENYVVPILNRHINIAVAQLYARDPTATARRRRQRMFKLWDGDPQTYQAALMAVQPPPTLMQTPMGSVDMATGAPWEPDPNAQALVQEVQEAQAHLKMMDGLAETMEILWDYYTAEQSNGFKAQMKALVRRAKVCGVGYVKLLFQRELSRHPEIGAQIDDASRQLAALEEGAQSMAEGDVEDDSAKAEEVRLLLQTLQAQEYLVAREGPVFDFPGATDIIIDPRVKHLKTLTGADWLAHEFEKTPEEVKQIYNVDIKKNYKEYNPSDDKLDEDGEKVSSIAKVYEIEYKRDGETFAICEGYPDFLREPGPPDLKLERFWSLFPLVFNEIEHKDRKIPPSDVWMLRHAQSEYNRSREALREHRIASRPKYATRKGSLGDTDRAALQSGAAHSIVELKALNANEDVNKVLQMIKAAPIDPNVYSVNEHFSDIQRVGNTQEANFGGTSKGSATEASISEQSRTTTATDNIDDLDDLLTEIAKAFAQVCLAELSRETVEEIVGPGAIWPDTPMSREEVAKDLFLEIKAGSSGRPNAAAGLAKMERAFPFLLQLPGIPPKPLAERYFQLLDMGVRLDDVYLEGMPSITALNAMMAKSASQPATGDPQTNPADQGGKGGQNAPKPAENEPQGQPAFPSSEDNAGR